MKILFLTDNFPPEFNAPATRTYEHCREWVKLGAEVVIITCVPNFPKGKVFDGYKNKWKQVEIIDGIKVIRVWSFIAPNAGTFKRTLDFVSFSITSFLAGIFIKSDVIVATSPQFFTAISGFMLGFFKRTKWIMEVRDIWPESIKAVNALDSNWVLEFLEKIELLLYRNAFRVIVVTDSFKLNLTQRGIDPSKIFVVKNGVDISHYQPREKNIEIAKKLAISNKFVVGYVGTHGLAHSLDFIVKCIAKITDREQMHFVFIGDGAEKKNLINLANRLALRNLTFVDAIKKSEIPSYLSVIDVALVPLRKATTFESVIPSKLFESVAMNIPILLGVDGESRSIIETYNAGVYFEPENEKSFLESLKKMHDTLMANPDAYVEGCQKMANDFNRKNLAKKMLSMMH
jgi:glycosyltransferase involved in cell wall biosynthesis